MRVNFRCRALLSVRRLNISLERERERERERAKVLKFTIKPTTAAPRETDGRRRDGRRWKRGVWRPFYLRNCRLFYLLRESAVTSIRPSGRQTCVESPRRNFNFATTANLLEVQYSLRASFINPHIKLLVLYLLHHSRRLHGC